MSSSFQRRGRRIAMTLLLTTLWFVLLVFLVCDPKYVWGIPVLRPYAAAFVADFFSPRFRDDRPPVTTGSVVILSLEKYRREKGEYPENLDVLAREGYSIPSPGCGNNIWRYEKTEKGFSLGVGWGSDYYPSADYRSEDERWVFDT